MLKNNSLLLENINELKNKNDWIVHNFEEETKKIYQKLNIYKEKLNKIHSIYQLNLNDGDNNITNQET